MTLKEKLHKIYETVDAVEKAGYNVAQKYKYVKASDMTRLIREQFTALKIYAEINFDFVGGPFTIARSKDKDAPFTAVLVKCSIVFHDLDSLGTLTSSGLGTGCDTNDKAAYKAQTGALKYALKNAFLVPDDGDQPEADESVDEGKPGYRQDYQPDYQEARHAAPRQNVAPNPKQGTERPVAATLDEGDSTREWRPTGGVLHSPLPPTVPAEKQNQGPAVAPEHGDAYEGADAALPTEEELNDYRSRFSKLGDELSTEGKLTASKSLPIGRKLLVFMLNVTKATDAKVLTKAQWEDFFERVAKAKALETGLVGLANLVNKANGIEKKQK